MKALFSSLFLFLLAGCSLHSSPKEEQAKMEMTLRKMRTDLDEVKHDLNSHQMELHVLEGKVLSQDQSLSSLKEQTLENHQGLIHQNLHLLTELEKKFSDMEKQFNEMSVQVKKFHVHANETKAALSQYQDKINEMESHMLAQSQKVKEITKLRNLLKEFIKANSKTSTYTVKNGDTLESIAKTYGVTIDSIRQLNKLSNDIAVGQEITIPVFSE